MVSVFICVFCVFVYVFFVVLKSFVSWKEENLFKLVEK